MRKVAMVLLVIGGMWMILACGGMYFLLFRTGGETQWAQTSSLPEKPSVLKMGDAGEILAETTAGNLYELTASDQTWKKVDQPSGNPAAGNSCALDDSNWSSTPKGKIKSTLSMNCVYAEMGYRFKLVILENGEIWYSESVDNSYMQLVKVVGLPFLTIACAPGALAFIVGLILLIVSKVKK
jgi:hypothetical protein